MIKNMWLDAELHMPVIKARIKRRDGTTSLAYLINGKWSVLDSGTFLLAENVLSFTQAQIVFINLEGGVDTKYE